MFSSTLAGVVENRLGRAPEFVFRFLQATVRGGRSPCVGRRLTKEWESGVDKRKKLLIGAALAVAAIGITGGVAVAQGEDDQPLRGNTYDRATRAALDHVGEGTVTETEVGDDGAAYGVEVRLSDGSQVEVQIDENFTATGVEQDDE
jgi:hypothetical protein